MKIMVYEYFSCGGSPRIPTDEDLFNMGWAMLSACIEDGLEAGHQVFTLMDSRIHRRLPGICTIKPVGQDQALSAFQKTLPEVDGVLLIAPETHGLLAELTSLVEQAGKLLLGSTTEGIRIAGDKYETYLALAKNGFKVPRTQLWPVALKEEEVPGPWIFKPRRGAGCEGVRLISPNDLVHVRTTGQDEYLIQEYVLGTAASVAMIVGKGKTLVLSVNRQKIALDSTLRYEGGAIPLVHPLSLQAAACARAVSTVIPGLKGYVGVDMVITENEIYVIEVNPRITFTYCGLRRATPKNLLKIIIDAALGLNLDYEVPLTTPVRFDESGHISSGEGIG